MRGLRSLSRELLFGFPVTSPSHIPPMSALAKLPGVLPDPQISQIARINLWNLRNLRTRTSSTAAMT